MIFVSLFDKEVMNSRQLRKRTDIYKSSYFLFPFASFTRLEYFACRFGIIDLCGFPHSPGIRFILLFFLFFVLFWGPQLAVLRI